MATPPIALYAAWLGLATWDGATQGHVDSSSGGSPSSSWCSLFLGVITHLLFGKSRMIPAWFRFTVVGGGIAAYLYGPRGVGCGGRSGRSTHWLDRVGAAQLRSSRRYPRLFSRGWGDLRIPQPGGRDHPTPALTLRDRAQVVFVAGRDGWFGGPGRLVPQPGPGLAPESRRAALQPLSSSVTPSRG